MTNVLIRQPLNDGEACPGCGQQLQAEYLISVDAKSNAVLTSLAGGQPVDLEGHIEGVRIQHDCIAKAKRGGTLGGLPHSRACGMLEHPHGPACHSNCPTCGGRAAGSNARELEVHPDDLEITRRKALDLA